MAEAIGDAAVGKLGAAVPAHRAAGV